jgi:hypothetical protein
MEITSKELLEITKILIKYLEKRGWNTITFSNDDAYYQKIWHKDRDLEKTPTITIGLLDEDIESLKLLLKGEPPTSYELERLGAVLNALGAIIDR